MLTRCAILLACAAFAAAAQESEYGFTLPVTLSAGTSTSPITAGARLMLYPTLKLGSHWFVYGALEERRTPYFYSDTGHGFDFQVVQAFVGYSIRGHNKALVIKAGELTTAFGSYPLRYDDAQNPLIDLPFTYSAQLPMHYRVYGWPVVETFTPVSLYGIPAVEADVSAGRFDARAQLSGGSPSYPEGWSGVREYRQWAAGAGVTIRQGFRLGASAFRGPYLDADAVPTSPRNFPATGIGADLQYATGRWSVNAEWQQFRFDLPGWPVTFSSAYAEAKRIVTPRFYVAARVERLKVMPQLTGIETTMGVWLGRHQLLKGGYEWSEGSPRHNTLGLQFVYSFQVINRSLR